MRSVNGEIIGAVLYCFIATILWATDTVTVQDMKNFTEAGKFNELIIIALIFMFIFLCGVVYRLLMKKQ